MDIFNTGLGLIIVIFLVILAILWFCLPFAIFGTKALIEESIKEQNALRKAIEELHQTIKFK
jgi:hypothetical protein